MSSVLSAAAAVFIMLPILIYLPVFVITKQVTGKHRKAVNAAVNTTTFVLIFSVHFLILTIWQQSFLWVMILLMLGIAVLFTFIYWKLKEEIIFSHVFTGVWRINFLILTASYIILLLYGAFSRVAHLVAAV